MVIQALLKRNTYYDSITLMSVIQHVKDTVEVDISNFEPRENDLFLLCSDGLSGMASGAQIYEVLSQVDGLERACDRLIQMANGAGGNDNVTCVLARYHRN